MVGRLVDRLKSRLGAVGKVVRSREGIESRRQGAGEERRGVQVMLLLPLILLLLFQEQLKVLGGRSKELQGDLEREIGVKYKGRNVNIMGVLL